MQTDGSGLEVVLDLAAVGRIVHHPLVHGVVRVLSSPTGGEARWIGRLPDHVVQEEIGMGHDT